MLITDQVVISVTNAVLLAIPPTLIAIGGLIVAIRNGGKTREVKTLVNGRMEEFLKVARELSHREGKEAGIKEIVENGQSGMIVSVTPVTIALPVDSVSKVK